MHNEIVAFGSGGNVGAGRRAINRQSGAARGGVVARTIAQRAGVNQNLAARVSRLNQAGRARISRGTGRAITRNARTLRAPRRR